MKHIFKLIFLIFLTLSIEASKRKSFKKNQIDTSDEYEYDLLLKKEERILFKALLNLGKDVEYLSLSKFHKNLVIKGFAELARERGIQSKRVVNLIAIMRELNV